MVFLVAKAAAFAECPSDYTSSTEAPNELSSGRVVSSSQMNENFDCIYKEVGRIEDGITVDSDGNVGIGTTNPNEKLDVRDGNITYGQASSAKLTHAYVGISADSWTTLDTGVAKSGWGGGGTPDYGMRIYEFKFGSNSVPDVNPGQFDYMQSVVTYGTLRVIQSGSTNDASAIWMLNFDGASAKYATYHEYNNTPTDGIRVASAGTQDVTLTVGDSLQFRLEEASGELQVIAVGPAVSGGRLYFARTL